MQRRVARGSRRVTAAEACVVTRRAPSLPEPRVVSANEILGTLFLIMSSAMMVNLLSSNTVMVTSKARHLAGNALCKVHVPSKIQTTLLERGRPAREATDCCRQEGLHTSS